MIWPLGVPEVSESVGGTREVLGGGRGEILSDLNHTHTHNHKAVFDVERVA